MRKRRVTGYNKEKIAMIATSLVIVSACAVTGVYIHGKEKEAAEEQIVDFTALEETAQNSENKEFAAQDTVENSDMDLAMLDQDLDADPFYQETNSSSIINPSISANTASADTQEETGEKRLAEEEEGSETKEADETDNQARGSEAGTAVTSEDKENTEGEDENAESEETMASGNTFSEQSKLAWPVEGNVIMNYSMDQTVYFATLNQYQYNPALIIQSEVGTQVKAPTDATVKEVGEDAKIGKYVVLDLGGGYSLTLGQLQNITIKEGSSVSENQTVAEVSEPSRYYSVEGSNIYMKLEKDGKTVDPMQFLGE